MTDKSRNERYCTLWIPVALHGPILPANMQEGAIFSENEDDGIIEYKSKEAFQTIDYITDEKGNVKEITSTKTVYNTDDEIYLKTVLISDDDNNDTYIWLKPEKEILSVDKKEEEEDRFPTIPRRPIKIYLSEEQFRNDNYELYLECVSTSRNGLFQYI